MEYRLILKPRKEKSSILTPNGFETFRNRLKLLCFNVYFRNNNLCGKCRVRTGDPYLVEVVL